MDRDILFKLLRKIPNTHYEAKSSRDVLLELPCSSLVPGCLPRCQHVDSKCNEWFWEPAEELKPKLLTSINSREIQDALECSKLKWNSVMTTTLLRGLLENLLDVVVSNMKHTHNSSGKSSEALVSPSNRSQDIA
jgi:hypothetical protein